MLADTTALIDFLRGKKKAIDCLRKVKVVHTTEINVFELITGANLAKRNTQARLEQLYALLSKIIVLPLDRKASIKAGEIAAKLIREGKRIEETDCLIAGIALSNGITQIITANKQHYDRIPGIKVILH